MLNTQMRNDSGKAEWDLRLRHAQSRHRSVNYYTETLIMMHIRIIYMYTHQFKQLF